MSGILPVPLNSLTPQSSMPVGGVVVISQPHPTDPTQRVFGTLDPNALPSGTGTGTSTPVSNLPTASSVGSNDLIVVNQNGVDKQATVGEVTGYGSTTTPTTTTPPATTPPATTPPVTATPPATTPPPPATTPPATTPPATTPPVSTTPATPPPVAGGATYSYPEGTVGPYGGIGDTGTGAGAQAYLYGRSLGDLFGTYTYPNPGGTDQGYTLKFTQDKLFSVTGVRPKYMNAFINNAYDSINRVGDGTFAYGWNNDDPTISGPNGYMRPIIGLKMHGWNDTKGNRDTFIDIQNGVYDNLYLTEMNTWIGFGYKHLVYRLAYEFDGTFMPDYFGGDAATNADFAAAMRHIILLMKNRASQAGILAEFTFNPSYINGTDTDVMNGWPGDDVIDIIDTDQYSACYPRYQAGGFMNFNPDGTPTGTYEQTKSTWILNPNNRKKFWNYPGIKDNYPPDIHDYDPGGWSTLRAISIAKAKGKRIAFSECGTGGSSDTDSFYNDDPTWVRWFWQTIQSAISQGVSVAHICIWNIYADDGRWMYRAPDSFDPQPNVALAYRKYFGDGQTTAITTPTTTPPPPPATTPPPTNTTTPVTNQNGGTLPTSGTGTPSPDGSTLNNTNGSLVDAAGITWTLFVVPNGFRPVLGGVGDSRIDANPVQSLLYYNNTMYALAKDGIWYAFANGEYTPQPGDPRPATLSGYADITDTAGITARINFTTATPTQDYYSSDTGLNTNIYFFPDPTTAGFYHLGASALGNVASASVHTGGINLATDFTSTFV